MDMAYNHLMALEETRAAGGVTYGMFTNILKAAHVTRHHAEDAERVLFRSLDRDRSGILSRADFRRLYQVGLLLGGVGASRRLTWCVCSCARFASGLSTRAARRSTPAICRRVPLYAS